MARQPAKTEEAPQEEASQEETPQEETPKTEARQEEARPMLPAHRPRTHPTDMGAFTSEEFGALIGSLAKACQKFKALKESGHVEYTEKRSGNVVKYDYSTLADLNDATREALAKEGMVFMQFPLVSRQGQLFVGGGLFHENGQFMAARMNVPPQGPGAKDIGMVITYCRRYVMQAILNLSGQSEDNESAFENQAAVFAAPAEEEAPAALPGDNFGDAGDPFDPYGGNE